MGKYILKRLLYLLIVLLIVVTITFFLVHFIPGDPITSMVEDLPEESRANYMAKYGLDKPLIVQYLIFMSNLLRGDLGESLRYPGRKVFDMVKVYGPVSFSVGIIGLMIGVVIGIILGVAAAYHRDKAMDRAVIILALLGTTIPTFVTASVLQYLFTVQWPLLPTVGWGEPRHFILPVLCTCFAPVASYARYMRSSVLDTLNQDFILTVRANGIPSGKIIFSHVLRNSVLPCITMFVTSVGSLLSGSFIVESIYSIPGMGSYFISSINNRDYSMVLGLNVVYTVIYVLCILISDVLLRTVDPRIRLAKED